MPVLVGTGIVLSALFALAVMHALLIGGQIRTDDLQRAVASETEEIHRLRLRVAQLESPDRVLEVARDRLGMVPPTEVGYLLPTGVDTGDDALVRVEAAQTPAVTAGSAEETATGDETTADEPADAEERTTTLGSGVDPDSTPGVRSDGTVAETLVPA
ncbi:MAG: FtsB family cell division protein [Acidimicrobiales bacterium]